MNQVFFGDCRDTLRQMAAQGIKTQSCVTSPPYFGLRSYMPDGVRLKPGLPDDALIHISSFLQGIGVCPHSVIRKSDLSADLRLYFVPAEIGREETLAESQPAQRVVGAHPALQRSTLCGVPASAHRAMHSRKHPPGRRGARSIYG